MKIDNYPVRGKLVHLIYKILDKYPCPMCQFIHYLIFSILLRTLLLDNSLEWVLNRRKFDQSNIWTRNSLIRPPRSNLTSSVSHALTTSNNFVFLNKNIKIGLLQWRFYAQFFSAFFGLFWHQIGREGQCNYAYDTF